MKNPLTRELTLDEVLFLRLFATAGIIPRLVEAGALTLDAEGWSLTNGGAAVAFQSKGLEKVDATIAELRTRRLDVATLARLRGMGALA